MRAELRRFATEDLASGGRTLARRPRGRRRRARARPLPLQRDRERSPPERARRRSVRLGCAALPRDGGARLPGRRRSATCASSRCTRCSGAGWAPCSSGHDDIGLLLVANVSALIFGGLLHQVVMRETGDPVLARAVGLARCPPPADVHARVRLLGGDVDGVVGGRLSVPAAQALVVGGVARRVGCARAPDRGAPGPSRVDRSGPRAWKGSENRERIASLGAVAGPVAGACAVPRVVGRTSTTTSSSRSASRRSTGCAVASSIRSRASATRSASSLHGDHLGAGAHILWAPIVIVFVIGGCPAVAGRRTRSTRSRWCWSRCRATTSARSSGTR